MSRTTLHLSKQNFKFSAAHFLIFDAEHAEKLHGHNYQVQVDIAIPNEDELIQEQGYFVDFNEFKKEIKARLDLWDEVILLPQLQKDMKFETKGQELDVVFRDRHYVFPKDEVVLLPITNTSVEQLSRILAEEFYQRFKKRSVKWVRVRVEETRGQGCSTVVGKS